MHFVLRLLPDVPWAPSRQWLESRSLTLCFWLISACSFLSLQTQLFSHLKKGCLSTATSFLVLSLPFWKSRVFSVQKWFGIFFNLSSTPLRLANCPWVSHEAVLTTEAQHKAEAVAVIPLPDVFSLGTANFHKVAPYYSLHSQPRILLFCETYSKQCWDCCLF